MRHKDPEIMRRIKEYVEEYALENLGRTPSLREIANKVGLTHPSVLRYLRSMDEMGLIRYRNGEISTDLIDKIVLPQSLDVSYADGMPAGPEDDLTDAVDEFISIPSAFKKGMGGSFFIATINGDSMVDAGIDSGDMIIVHRQESARVGDIVVALIDKHGSTLKRICEDEKGIYLWAENESWDDESRFYGRNFSVQGVCIKVVKDV